MWGCVTFKETVEDLKNKIETLLWHRRIRLFHEEIQQPLGLQLGVEAQVFSHTPLLQNLRQKKKTHGEVIVRYSYILRYKRKCKE